MRKYKGNEKKKPPTVTQDSKQRTNILAEKTITPRRSTQPSFIVSYNTVPKETEEISGMCETYATMEENESEKENLEGSKKAKIRTKIIPTGTKPEEHSCKQVLQIATKIAHAKSSRHIYIRSLHSANWNAAPSATSRSFIDPSVIINTLHIIHPARLWAWWRQ